MNSVPAAVLVAVVLASPRPLPQALPDFSGTWTIDRERSESPHQGDAFTPPTFVITQTSTDITIETRRGTARSAVRYPIGPATAPLQTAPSPGHGEPAGRAYWVGASLVTEGQNTIQGQTVSTRETRTLDATGTEMTLETLLVVQHGYTFKGAQNYGAAKDIYRKVVAPRR
jgi:hypothetical protein